MTPYWVCHDCHEVYNRPQRCKDCGGTPTHRYESLSDIPTEPQKKSPGSIFFYRNESKKTRGD